MQDSRSKRPTMISAHMSVREASDPAQPRAMRDSTEVERRKSMLRMPHIAPLADYVDSLRARLGYEVPDFDPLDGGVEAQILFLFEKPGPMTAAEGQSARAGSGFISRDNDDPTAEATFRFMEQAGIPRKSTALWNAVPGWNGTRRVTASEMQAGMRCMTELIALLDKLRAIVLVGKKAERARAHLAGMPFAIFTSLHPSPIVRARWPERWSAIGTQWSEARTLLAENSP